VLAPEIATNTTEGERLSSGHEVVKGFLLDWIDID